MKHNKSFSSAKQEFLFIWIIPVFVIVLPAILFVIYRAANLSFTHDECCSFTLANGIDTYYWTPNNHLLNTFLMKIFGNLTGQSELSLRLPNVLAFILYCIAGLGVIRNIKKPAISVFFMAILILNTIMLEFFGLARGYGLSMGLSMASFYCLFMLDNTALPAKKYLIYFVLTLIFSQLAIYANLSALNLHVALLIVLIAGLIPYLKMSSIKNSKSRINMVFAGILFVDLLALWPAINRLIRLQERNELSVFGGSEGLINTTLKSLISTFFYYQPYTPRIFSIVQISVISVFAISGLWVIIKLFRKQFDNFSRTFFILSLLLLAPVLQNYFFKIPFPVDRTALLYFPLFSLLVIFLFSQLISLTRYKLIKAFIVILLIGSTSLIAYNFYKNYNLIYTNLWRVDTYNRQMMKLIDEDRVASGNEDSVKVACVWIFEPPINYYRVSRKYDWLIPADRDGLNKEADYYISLVQDIPGIPCDSLIVLKQYDDVQTVLTKRYKEK